jgi:undecaprenyl-diphosphatase
MPAVRSGSPPGPGSATTEGVPLFHLAVLAALSGLTEALGVSASGHDVAARLWLDALDARTPAAAFGGALPLGAALGLAVAARRRLAEALAEGVRAVARPALFRGSPPAHEAMVLVIGSGVSLVTGAMVAPRVEMWRESPTATGVGLWVTGLALASTALAPRPARSLRPPAGAPDGGLRPSAAGAVMVGMAHGLAVFPGASRVGAALTLLLWMGVKPARAVDLGLLLAVPALLVAFFQQAAGALGGASPSLMVMGLVLAFVGARVASEVLRSLGDRRRVAWLSLWTIPLGLATIAYARALPGSL